MIAVDVRWTRKVNLLIVVCDACGTVLQHRMDRWRVRCPVCGRTERVEKLRNSLCKRLQKRKGGGAEDDAYSLQVKN